VSLALVDIIVAVVFHDSTSLVTAMVIKSQSRGELWEDVLELVLSQVRSRVVVDLICPHLEDILHADRILLEVPLLVVEDHKLLRLWNLVDLFLTQHLNSLACIIHNRWLINIELLALAQEDSTLEEGKFPTNVDELVRPGVLEHIKNLIEVTFSNLETFGFHHYGCVNVRWGGEDLLSDDVLRISPMALNFKLLGLPPLFSQMLAQKRGKILVSIIDILDINIGSVSDGLFSFSILGMVIVLENDCQDHRDFIILLSAILDEWDILERDNFVRIVCYHQVQHVEESSKSLFSNLVDES